MAKKPETPWTHQPRPEHTAAPAGFEEIRSGFALAEPGDELTGVYKGQGSPKPSKKKGQPAIRTYRILTDTGEIEILGAAQIDQFMRGIKEGDTVWIKREGQISGGKGRVNTYRFGVKRKSR